MQNINGVKRQKYNEHMKNVDNIDIKKANKVHFALLCFVQKEIKQRKNNFCIYNNNNKCAILKNNKGKKIEVSDSEEDSSDISCDEEILI